MILQRHCFSVLFVLEIFVHMLKTSLVAQLVKNPPAMQETRLRSLVWKILWRRDRLPIPVFLTGEFHGLEKSMGSQRVGHN